MVDHVLVGLEAVRTREHHAALGIRTRPTLEGNWMDLLRKVLLDSTAVPLAVQIVLGGQVNVVTRIDRGRVARLAVARLSTAHLLDDDALDAPEVADGHRVRRWATARNLYHGRPFTNVRRWRRGWDSNPR